MKTIANNRQAFHLYEILETYETGIVLQGFEVKSIRNGKINLKDSFARIEKGEMFLFNTHISPYEQSGGFARKYNPTRQRKLLLHKSEILRIHNKVSQRGLTLVPLEVYFEKGFVKIKLALAKGKRVFDKRESIRRRELDRDVQRTLKEE